MDEVNKGLPTKLLLNDGKFVLTSGTDKVDDNVSMLLCFVGWFRFYKQDYVINAYRFYQNTTNYLLKYKNTLRLSVLDIGNRYVPFAKFNSVDLPIDRADRKSTTLYISFSYNIPVRDNATTNTTIKRLIN